MNAWKNPNAISFARAAAAFRSGKDTPRNFLERCIATVEKREPSIKAFVSLDLKAARKSADQSTRRYRKGTALSPVDVCPVAIKDIIATADMPTQMNSPVFKGWQTGQDAACVQALRAGGAVIFGKTVTTEFAIAYSGPTTNPFDPQRTPGSADQYLRAELLLLEENSPGSLYAHLARLDPETAGNIQDKDIRRIVRALEVCLKSREKISLLRKKLTSPLPYEFIKIGLTRERKELYRIIDERVEQMIRAGFMEEAETILRKCPDRTAMQAIGYKELAMHLNNEIDKDEAIRLIRRNTRRYAKRQFTWFKKEEDIIWVDVTGIFDSTEVFHSVRAALLRTCPEIFRGNRTTDR